MLLQERSKNSLTRMTRMTPQPNTIYCIRLPSVIPPFRRWRLPSANKSQFSVSAQSSTSPSLSQRLQARLPQPTPAPAPKASAHSSPIVADTRHGERAHLHPAAARKGQRSQRRARCRRRSGEVRFYAPRVQGKPELVAFSNCLPRTRLSRARG